MRVHRWITTCDGRALLALAVSAALFGAYAAVVIPGQAKFELEMRAGGPDTYSAGIFELALVYGSILAAAIGVVFFLIGATRRRKKKSATSGSSA
ncbi:MAG: hypothetical protein ACOH2F_20380 [Cellulomonas sp.]